MLVAELVAKEDESVLIHCSDGWDRTVRTVPCFARAPAALEGSGPTMTLCRPYAHPVLTLCGPYADPMLILR